MPFLESKKGGYPEKCRAISSFPLLLGGQIVDLGERLNGIQAVSGSIPLISTIKIAGRTQSYEIIVLWHGFWLALDLTAQV